MGVRVGVANFFFLIKNTYIYFMGSETLPTACYLLFDESSIPFYSSINGYNNNN